MDCLYENLENYNESDVITQLRAENRELRDENNDLKSELQEIRIKLSVVTEEAAKLRQGISQDFDVLHGEHKKLLINFSSLLKTSKAEVERKGATITNLHKELDGWVVGSLQKYGNRLLHVERNIHKGKRKNEPAFSDSDSCKSKVSSNNDKSPAPEIQARKEIKHMPSEDTTSTNSFNSTEDIANKLKPTQDISASTYNKKYEAKENRDHLLVRSDQLPVRSDRLPLRSAQLTLRSDQLPVRLDQLPGRSNQLPGRPNQLLGRSDHSPLRSGHLPIRSDQFPKRSDQLPKSIETTKPRASENSKPLSIKKRRQSMPISREEYAKFSTDEDNDKGSVEHESEVFNKHENERVYQLRAGNDRSNIKTLELHPDNRYNQDPYTNSRARHSRSDYHDSDKYINKDRYDTTYRHKRNLSPDRHWRGSNDYYREHQATDYRKERNDYHTYKDSPDRYSSKTHYSNKYEQQHRHKHDYDKPNIKWGRHEYHESEPSSKRAKIDSQRDFLRDRYQRDKELDLHTNVQTVPVEKFSRQTPEFASAENCPTQTTREIRSTAVTQLDDPRKISNKHTTKQKEDDVTNTQKRQNVGVIIPHSQWGVNRIEVPEALKKPPETAEKSSKEKSETDLLEVIYKDVEENQNTLESFESGELDDYIFQEVDEKKTDDVNNVKKIEKRILSDTQLAGTSVDNDKIIDVKHLAKESVTDNKNRNEGTKKHKNSKGNKKDSKNCSEDQHISKTESKQHKSSDKSTNCKKKGQDRKPEVKPNLGLYTTEPEPKDDTVKDINMQNDQKKSHNKKLVETEHPTPKIPPRKDSTDKIKQNNDKVAKLCMPLIKDTDDSSNDSIIPKVQSIKDMVKVKKHAKKSDKESKLDVATEPKPSSEHKLKANKQRDRNRKDQDELNTDTKTKHDLCLKQSDGKIKNDKNQKAVCEEKQGNALIEDAGECSKENLISTKRNLQENDSEMQISDRQVVASDLLLSDENSDLVEHEMKCVTPTHCNKNIDVDIKDEVAVSVEHISDDSKIVDKNKLSETVTIKEKNADKPDLSSQNIKKPKRSKKQKKQDSNLKDKVMDESNGKSKKHQSEIKSKFSDLFGDSNSLIMPEDLGVSSGVVAVSIKHNYLPICEDAQDAVDLITRQDTISPQFAKPIAVEAEQCESTETEKVKQQAEQPVPMEVEIVYSNADDSNIKVVEPEPDVVKTVVISSGIQSSVPEPNINEQEIGTKKTNLDVLRAQNLNLQALATSTPHKVVQAQSLSNPDAPNNNSLLDQSSDTNTLDSENATDAPDVRIFVKRRRKVAKRPATTF